MNPGMRRKRRARLATVALCLAVGACATAPEAPLPPAPIPAAYSAAYPGAAADAGAPALPDWQSFFLDAELRRILALALANSRDLRAAELRVREAAAAYDIQRSERYPFVGANLAGTRALVPPAGSPTGRSMLGNQFQAGIGFADWELDLWGRLRSLNRAALEAWLAADATRRFASLSLVAQVADAYLGLRELDERLALARRTLASRDESLRIFRRRHALGAASRLNLTQVELLRQQALGQVAQLEQARAQQAALLDLLAGTPVTPAPAAGPLGDAQLARELDPGLPSALLQERPDIVAAEHALRAARADVRAARAAFFPRIALTASAGTASTALDRLFDRDSRAWTFAPSLALPLFTGGRLEGQLAVSQVRRDQAVAQYERTVQGAFRDVADALAARRWLAGQAQALQATVQLQGERARLAKLRYDSGAAAYLEVLDAERERFGAEQQLVQLQRQRLSAQVALYRALGGGARRLPELAPARDE